MPSNKHAALILDYLQSFHPMPPSLQEEFKSQLFDIKAEKDSYLLKQGETSQHFYFIIKGIVIGYTSRMDKVVTMFICTDGDPVSSISGMYGECPSSESLYVAEESHLIAVPTKAMINWLGKSIEMNIIVRKILEMFYKNANERAIVVRMGGATEKCNYYFDTFPHHNVNRVPAQYIADFLEIRPATLIKILTKKHVQVAELSPEETELVENYMSKQLAFKHQGLTLAQMAKDIGISPHPLSYLLNSHYKQGFNTFVNRYRINFVKEKLQRKKEWQHLKIEVLGNEGGFSSRSAFFSEFKRHTGLSPAAYAKQFCPPS